MERNAMSLRSVEQFDDGVRQTGELTERLNDWLVADQVGFIERYKRGAINIGLIPPVFGEQPNYGFVVHADIAANRLEPVGTADSKSFDEDSLRTDCRQNQPLVLSHNVE